MTSAEKAYEEWRTSLFERVPGALTLYVGTTRDRPGDETCPLKGYFSVRLESKKTGTVAVFPDLNTAPPEFVDKEFDAQWDELIQEFDGLAATLTPFFACLPVENEHRWERPGVTAPEALPTAR
jgi:hypothetical protein